MAGIKIDRNYAKIAALAAIFLFAAILFGMPGLRTFLGFYLVLILPVFLIFKKLGLDEDETIFFSFFIALVFMPLLVWYIDRIFSNLIASTAVAAVIAYAVALYLMYGKNWKNPTEKKGSRKAR
jgi:apolipoprotein N-acyltransferase